MDETQEESRSDEELKQSHENISEKKTEDEAPEMDIDPVNEVKGIKLLLIHTGICLCTFLIGLVSLDATNAYWMITTADQGKDFNLIATAVPVITSQFHSIHDIGWYGSAFYITL